VTAGDRAPWTLTGIAMGLVVLTALGAGLVVARWTGEASYAGESRSAPPGPAGRAAAGTPSAPDVQACNVFARAVARDDALEAISDAGAATGTAYGLDEARVRDARYVRAYRSCMKGRGFTG
jgi:hypothetical protein